MSHALLIAIFIVFGMFFGLQAQSYWHRDRTLIAAGLALLALVNAVAVAIELAF